MSNGAEETWTMHVAQATCKEVSLTYKKSNEMPSFNELGQTANFFSESNISCCYFVKKIQHREM